MQFGVCMILLSVLCLCSCENKNTTAALADISTYIESFPDSALAAIRAVDTTTIHTRKQRAEYSLLNAMALDKSYIDTNDIRIILPAINYYRNKNRTKYILSRFYLGRIYYNAGAYEKARSFMKQFLLPLLAVLMIPPTISSCNKESYDEVELVVTVSYSNTNDTEVRVFPYEGFDPTNSDMLRNPIYSGVIKAKETSVSFTVSPGNYTVAYYRSNSDVWTFRAVQVKRVQSTTLLLW